MSRWKRKSCFFYQILVTCALIACYIVLVESCCTVEFGEVRFANCKEMWTESADCVFANISEDNSPCSTHQET